MCSAFQGGNHTVNIEPEDGDPEIVLEVFNRRNVVWEVVHAILIDEPHNVYEIRENIKDTLEQYKRSMENTYSVY